MSGFIGIKDCGNAPRKLLLQDFYKAIYYSETSYLADYLHDQIIWDFPGITFEKDKQGALKHLAQSQPDKISQLRLEKMITHGPEAAVTGTLTSDSGTVQQFCDIFTFNSAGGSLIKAITSFRK